MLMNLILFVGCGGSDSPYPMGLKVNLSATVDEVTVSYRMNEGDDATRPVGYSLCVLSVLIGV